MNFKTLINNKAKSVMGGRNPLYDYLKTLAIFFVLCTHCKTQDDITDNAIISKFLDFLLFCNGVPIFFAVSGALLLSKERPIRYYLKKMAKTALLVIIWSIIQTILCTIYRNEPIDTKAILLHVLHQDLYYCNYMWYLCALFGIYSLTPFLESFVKKGRNELNYTIGFALLFSALSGLAWKFNPIKGSMCNASFAYYVMGYVIYCTALLNKLQKHSLLILFVTLITLSLYEFFIPDLVRTYIGYDYTSIFGVIFICSFLVYVKSKEAYLTKHEIISYIGKNTLGIYLLQGPIYKCLDAYIPSIHFLGIVYPLIVMVLCLMVLEILKSNKITNYIVSL